MELTLTRILITAASIVGLAAYAFIDDYLAKRKSSRQ
ncbi:hypothetical protein P343_12830 [Sporolactobacillus laevolacticus DSM 442]|uniref:Uncharacterized protein n=1 Tax=Sporolactobacillus laevolacticus DSM 442 TaxID=1395513 RepID=V6IVS0_9BACL|nr:hypothetical protein P343_12830 [Sporolactobacillus laevolacticus DSM 442]